MSGPPDLSHSTNTENKILFETARLLVRRLVPEDIDSLAALYCDPEVRQYFPEGTLDREQTREELEWYLDGHPSYPELGLWAVISKEDGQFIGRGGLLPWTIDRVFEVEVAYLIARSRWGKGLGTEVALGIRDYAFEALGLSRLVCLIDENNRASIRVAEKIGMTFEKEGKDELGTFHLYAIER